MKTLKSLPKKKKIKTTPLTQKEINTLKFLSTRFTGFKIVVPNQNIKSEIQAALKYLHDNKHVDKSNVIINILSNSFSNQKAKDLIVVDSNMYSRAYQKSCKHSMTYVNNGIRICSDCGNQLEVTSYRD